MNKELYNVFKYIQEKDNKKISDSKSFKLKVLYTDWKQEDFTEKELSQYSLNLSGNNLLARLPDNLNIEKSLYINGTSIKKLPANLRVGMNLWISLQYITKLPDDLSVGNDIYVSGDQEDVTAFKKHVLKTHKKSLYHKILWASKR